MFRWVRWTCSASPSALLLRLSRAAPARPIRFSEALGQWGHRPSRPSVVGHRHRAGLGAPVRVLRVRGLERDAGPHDPAVDVRPVQVGVHRSGVAPAGEQQRVGRFLGHPLDGIAEGELKAVVGREPLEGVGRAHALADAPADAGGVVEDEPQRHAAARTRTPP